MSVQALLGDDGRCRGRAALAVAAILLFATADSVVAQQPAPAQSMVEPPPAAAPDEPPPTRRPGLLDALGDLFSLKGAQETIDEFNRKAGEAGANLTRLPGTRAVAGRTRCAPSANGAPDCAAAAITLCRSNGFGSGASLATESGERCPARVYLSGRPPKPGECRTETFVTSAMCQ